MNVSHKIANYFRTWSGEDESVTNIQLSTQDCRDIADLHFQLSRATERLKHFRTHDLRMNPDDLPRSNGRYLVYRPNFYGKDSGKIDICYFDGTDTWHDSDGVDFTRVLNREDISAWKYIDF